MVDTSTKAREKNAAVRVNQTYGLFIWLHVSCPEGETAAELSTVMQLPIGTIHARINDLKKGIFYGGKWYYAYDTGRREKNGNGNPCIVWGLSDMPAAPDLQKELDALDKKIRRLFQTRRRIKERIKTAANPSIF
jgi:hypothetical protein